MSESVDTVYIISPVDFEKVQRHTERYYLAKYCSENYNTHVITPSSSIPGVSNHNFYFESILGILYLNVLFLPLWVKLFLQNPPDVVHCYPDVIFPQYVARFLTDSQVVFDVRADPFEQHEEFSSQLGQDDPIYKQILYDINRYFFQWAVNRADLVVTLSDDLATKICENYNIDPDSIHLTPQGVDVDKFKPSGTDTSRVLSIAYVGTINGLRGLDTFFDALSQLDPQARSKLQINLSGGGNREFIDEVLATTTDSMPELTVNYHGYVDHDRIPTIVGKNDLAVSPLPALESYNVSSPAKVYEYLSLGLAVIATDIPAHQRILTDTEDSIMVDPESPEQIAAALETLLDDPDSVLEMGEHARQNALEHSWESRFKELFEKINELSPE